VLNAVIPEGTAPADGIALGVDGDAQAANPASTTNDAQARLNTFDTLDLLLIDISDLTTVDRSHPIRDFHLRVPRLETPSGKPRKSSRSALEGLFTVAHLTNMPSV
jgi:hypothetical protein